MHKLIYGKALAKVKPCKELVRSSFLHEQIIFYLAMNPLSEADKDFEVSRSVSMTARQSKLTVDLFKHSIHVLQIVMV